MYDAFSADYDRFVDWPGRLAMELPLIEDQLAAVEAGRVLDVACGTGMHAVALAQRGFAVAGADISQGMIEFARANAASAGVRVRFEVAGFGELHERMGGDYDALLCLGNSLPHVLTPVELAQALRDMAQSLRPGGRLLIQNRNFDSVLADRERWIGPQSRREARREWLFMRFYDFDPDDRLTFNVVTLQRESEGPWEQRVASTRLWPLRAAELTAALAAVDLEVVARWGSMAGDPFDGEHSPNLVVAARRPDVRVSD
jgi:SAM-dependent methyltransferase